MKIWRFITKGIDNSVVDKVFASLVAVVDMTHSVVKLQDEKCQLSSVIRLKNGLQRRQSGLGYPGCQLH